MKDLIKLGLELGKNSVLDGTLNANDLRNNKKQMAVKFVKTAAWTLIQRHPLFVGIKYGFMALAAFAILSLIGGIYFFL